MIKKIIKDYTPNWKALDSTCEQAKAIQDMYDQIREFYNYLNSDDIYKNIEQHIKSSGDLNQFITIDDLNQRKYVSVDVIKSILFQYLSDWKETNSKSPSFIRNKPTDVSAFTNDVGYLTEHQDISGKADKTEIPTKVSQLENDEHFINDVSDKQDTLVSGENIKTINSNSILGRGNIEIGGYEPPIGGIPESDLSIEVQSLLDKADSALQEETDPTVPSWAKTPNKPSYDYGEINNVPDLTIKENVTQIVAPVNEEDATLAITTLTTEVGKYYRIDVPVDTLNVSLPATEDNTIVRTVVLYLTAGTTPAVTISAADGKEVLYQDGFEIEAGKTYEVNALYNGAVWVVASVEIIVE